MFRFIQGEEKKRQIMSEFDPLTGETVGNNISSPAEQVRQLFVPRATQAEGQLTERAWSTNRSAVVDRDNGLLHQLSKTPIPPTPGDESDIPTLKRVPALPRQTSFLPIPEDLSDIPTLKRVPAFPGQTSFLPTPEDVSGTDSEDLPGNRQVEFPHKFQDKNTWRTAVITLLLLLIASATVGIVLISRQNAALAGLKGTFFYSSKILLGGGIVLPIAFTVRFNFLSTVSFSTTRP